MRRPSGAESVTRRVGENYNVVTAPLGTED
uniref:Uncharacterized protein n=1 Tax=Setaria viridis TaxID=4556 RepID=A0A4U6WNF8_SETVI|nr:hypothetical protein SEVIR_1G228700v2 [Setaria viridis]